MIPKLKRASHAKRQSAVLWLLRHTCILLYVTFTYVTLDK